MVGGYTGAQCLLASLLVLVSQLLHHQPSATVPLFCALTPRPPPHQRPLPLSHGLLRGGGLMALRQHPAVHHGLTGALIAQRPKVLHLTLSRKEGGWE
jgi:hypothetical protein